MQEDRVLHVEIFGLVITKCPAPTAPLPPQFPFFKLRGGSKAWHSSGIHKVPWTEACWGGH